MCVCVCVSFCVHSLLRSNYFQTPLSTQPTSFSKLSPFLPTLLFAVTHSSGGQHGRVVIDVRDSDDGGGCVREAKVEIALHVRGLHDDGILGHFL